MSDSPDANRDAPPASPPRSMSMPRGDALRAAVVKLRNLLTLALEEVVEAPPSTVALSEVYIEIAQSGAWLRMIGEHEAMEIDSTVLSVVAAEGVEALDLVFTGDSCFDLSFDMPDGPLAELRQLIEREIQFRSPFSADVAQAFWIAEEKPAGGWRINAAVALAKQIEEVETGLTALGLRLGVIRREGRTAAFAARPSWAHEAQQVTGTWRRIWRSLPPVLQSALGGTAILLTSALVLSVQTSLATGEIEARADAARADLRRMARVAAEARATTDALARSTERAALLGHLTEILPDGIWLDQLLIDDGTLTLQGFAPSAAEVTRLLSEMEQLSSIRFASPVVRDNSQSIERFRIAADLPAETP